MIKNIGGVWNGDDVYYCSEYFNSIDEIESK